MVEGSKERSLHHARVGQFSVFGIDSLYFARLKRARALVIGSSFEKLEQLEEGSYFGKLVLAR